MVVSLIALIATIAVYGVVALIVRMDDAGLHLIERVGEIKGFSSTASVFTGNLLINSLPKVIHLLGIIGTIAMLLVGGGMFVHNIDALHHLLTAIPTLLADLIVGLVVGMVLFTLMSLFKSIRVH
jgi:predicted DNA repair protein MutK